jgi:hypothetical protein
MHYTRPMTNTEKPRTLSPAAVAANHLARVIREAQTPVYTTETKKG